MTTNKEQSHSFNLRSVGRSFSGRRGQKSRSDVDGGHVGRQKYVSVSIVLGSQS